MTGADVGRAPSAPNSVETKSPASAGGDRLTAPNNSADGRAQNRRVEIRLMSNDTTKDGTTSAQSTAPNPSR